MPISKASFDFLSALRENNSRDWFNARKPEYQQHHEEMKAFLEEVKGHMQEHDHIDDHKCRVYRIYRDVRFSKDKTPYKSNWSASLARATKSLRGGYFFSLSPGRSMIAGGFWGPNKEDLLHIRKQISQDPEPLRQVIESTTFKKTFGVIDGEQLKTAPKGFDKEHPAIDLLRYKQFVLRRDLTEAQVLSPDFAKTISDGFREMRPFFDYMSDILTSDLNGMSLVD